MDADVKAEIEKASFMPGLNNIINKEWRRHREIISGEYVLVTGEVVNGPHSSNLKAISIELRQRILYKSGDGAKNEWVNKVSLVFYRGSFECVAGYPKIQRIKCK